MNTQELTLGRYFFEDHYEDDNIKRFHFFEDHKGDPIHIDFSPYYTVTEHDKDAVREFVEATGRIPRRRDNNGHNFRKGDIFNLLKSLWLCGNPECTEQYEHWTGGY